MRIVKSITFDAAHYLDQVDVEGALAYKEERPYARMHGHSFRLEVEIAGDAGEQTGWVVDFAEVDEELAALREKLDHRLLNQVEGLERPTLENICKWVAGQLKPRFAGLTAVRVSRPSNGETCIYDL